MVWGVNVGISYIPCMECLGLDPHRPCAFAISVKRPKAKILRSLASTRTLFRAFGWTPCSTPRIWGQNKGVLSEKQHVSVHKTACVVQWHGPIRGALISNKKGKTPEKSTASRTLRMHFPLTAFSPNLPKRKLDITWTLKSLLIFELLGL